MFSLSLPVAEKILRPVLVYVFLVVCLRIFGKRELVQLNPFDFVVLLSLANTVQNAIIGEDNSLIGGLIGALALLATNWLVVRFLFKHRRLDQLVAGKPTVLIEHGKVRKDALAKEMMTHSELVTLAHRQGFRTLNEIETCILQPGGVFEITGHEPRAEELNYKALMARLDELGKQIDDLKGRLPA
jgi:uncharacterized membrane protein YcaP (DUF421 family)